MVSGRVGVLRDVLRAGECLVWANMIRLEFDPPLDEGIKAAVELLCKHGIETYESCEGGEGHSYPEPTVCFQGDRSEGFKALAIILQHGLPVAALRRAWSIEDGEPVGPHWDLVFWRKISDMDVP